MPFSNISSLKIRQFFCLFRWVHGENSAMKLLIQSLIKDKNGFWYVSRHTFFNFYVWFPSQNLMRLWTVVISLLKHYIRENYKFRAPLVTLHIFHTDKTCEVNFLKFLSVDRYTLHGTLYGNRKKKKWAADGVCVRRNFISPHTASSSLIII